MGFIENFGENWATFGQTEPYFWEKLKTEAEKLRLSEGRASYILPKSAQKKPELENKSFQPRFFQHIRIRIEQM